MAISVVGAGTLATGTGNVTPGLPSGWAAGDIHHLYVSTANEAVSAPVGWTEVTNSPQSTGTAGGADGIRLTIFWRRAEGGDTAPTVTDPGNHCAARILGFRGCVTTGDPHDVTSGDIEATAIDTCTFTGITTTVTNTVLVHVNTRATQLIGVYTFTPSNGSLASFNQQILSGWSDGNGGNLAVWTATKATAGATGDSTGTWFKVAQDASDVQALMLMALEPAIEIACDPGSYAISGTACALQVVRQIACDPGSYAISGTACSLQYARQIACDPGSYAISGTACNLQVARLIVCDPGSYVISGTEIALELQGNYIINLESGSIQTHGIAASFGGVGAPTAGNRVPFCQCCQGDVCCTYRCAPGETCDNPMPATLQCDVTDDTGQCTGGTFTLFGGSNRCYVGQITINCLHECEEASQVRLHVEVCCEADGWGIAVLQMMPDVCLTSSNPSMTMVSCDPVYLQTDFCQECESPLFDPGCPPTLAYCFSYVVYEV